MNNTTPAWTRVSHVPLRRLLEIYADLTGDNELYGYTYSPSGRENRVKFRDYTALTYKEACDHVQSLINANNGSLLPRRSQE